MGEGEGERTGEHERECVCVRERERESKESYGQQKGDSLTKDKIDQAHPDPWQACKK